MIQESRKSAEQKTEITRRYGTEKDVEREFPNLKASRLRHLRWKGGGPLFYKKGRSVWYELNHEVPAWIESGRVENTSQCEVR